jgi:lysophospholipase L1-like esterase
MSGARWSDGRAPREVQVRNVGIAACAWVLAAGLASAEEPMVCEEVARGLRDMMRQDARMRDWPQLGRYRTANVELRQSRQPVQVVFFGDSITDSWNLASTFPEKPYVNRGISGQTTPQMLVRLRPDVLAHQPKVLVLLAGTNDIAGNTGPATNGDIQENIAAIAELASKHGVRVVLASVLPVSNYHFQPARDVAPQTVRRPMGRITALNDWLRQYAAAHGHVYLDYFAAMVDAQGFLKTEFSDDDLHPNAAGYAVMAPLAEAAIAKALAGSAGGSSR